MATTSNPPFSPHLADLLLPTPSGAAKLLAAWDGLSAELQMQILESLNKSAYPDYLGRRLRIHALSSVNAYVRYLSARSFTFASDLSEEDRLLKTQIEEDSSELVRSSLQESSILPKFGAQVVPIDKVEFIELPQASRLARLRASSYSSGVLSDLIVALGSKRDHSGALSWLEVHEIVAEVVYSSRISKNYAGESSLHLDSVDFDRDRALRNLWLLIPSLPHVTAVLLLKNLCPSSAMQPTLDGECTIAHAEGEIHRAEVDGEFVARLVASLSDLELTSLLERADVGLEELRRKLFFSEGSATETISWHSAAAANFKLSLEDFSRILAMPVQARRSAAVNLAMCGCRRTERTANIGWRKRLTLRIPICVYVAIRDILAEQNLGLTANEDSRFARTAACFRHCELNEHERRFELLQVRLLELAKQAAPWSSADEERAPTGELSFLARHVVPGDTWATFVAFSRAWTEESNRLVDFLPQAPGYVFFVPELVPAEEESPLERMEARLRQLAEDMAEQNSSMAKKLASVEEQMAAQTGEFRYALSRVSQRQAEDVQQFSFTAQAAAGHLDRLLEKNTSEVRSSLRRLQILIIFAAIAVLAILLAFSSG